MSRCFPYPPPGFNGKRASNEALIESIKLRKEKEKAKTERKKEKKREKKEKRKESKEIKENKENGKLTTTGIDHKREKNLTELKGEYNNKRKQEDAEQLERSGLTEEHGHPLNLQNPNYLSDSTQNSNKRRRQASPVNGCLGPGNIIRIRLSLQKHKEPDVSASKEQLCSTSGRTELPGHHGHDVGSSTQEVICATSLGTNNVVQGLSFGPDKKLSCSTSGRTGIFGQDDKRIASASTSLEIEMHRLNSLYNDLIQNLVPPALRSDLSDFDDEEWLFRRKYSDRGEEKRSKAIGDVSSCGSSTVWPRAHYLPEAEIYVLPYTVPF